MKSRDNAVSAVKKFVKRRIVARSLAGFFPDYFANQLLNPVFIIGSMRSGTTLFTEMLEQHQDIANWSEANNVWDPQWPHRMPPIWYDPVAHTNSWWHDTKERQTQIGAIFGAYQWLSRKPFFVNKSPLNTFRLPYLQKMFPGARFINMVRDGRAVILSNVKHRREIRPDETQRMLGDDYTFEALCIRLAAFWKASVEEVARQDKALGLSQQGLLLELAYEEFCAAPDANLVHVCHFLGLNPDRFSNSKRNKPIKSQNFKWREGLNPHLVEQLIAIMQPTFGDRGYA
jgi:hypothetical protein